VLDIVGHHRQHRGKEKTAKVTMLERGESDFLRRSE
jgi:hypothetical protein